MKDIVIPKQANKILNALENSGHEAYLVGGCVRDLLIGEAPKDWDITTSAKPREIKEIFQGHRIITLGEKFGTIGVYETSECNNEKLNVGSENFRNKRSFDKTDKAHILYEITTFRKESGYNDGRHPEGITFTDKIEDDLLRRDFTINGMAFNNRRGLVDIFGGLEDLKARKIKTIGPPEKRFDEDGLRVIRAIRFAAQLGFVIENTTKSAIYDFKNVAKKVPIERLTYEFEKLITGDFADETINEYADALKYILNIDFRCNSQMNHLPKDVAIRLAAMMPGNFEQLKIGKKFLLEATKIYWVSRTLCKENRNLTDIKNVMRMYRYDVVRKGFILNGEDICILDEIKSSGQCYNLKQLAVKGSDLDWLRGEEIGHTLEELLTLVISGRLDNEANLLIEYARSRWNHKS